MKHPQKKLRNKPKDSEREKMMLAYNTKYAEFDKFTLEELEQFFGFKDKKKRIGGIHKKALIDVCSKKLQERVIANNQVVNELPVVNTTNNKEK